MTQPLFQRTLRRGDLARSASRCSPRGSAGWPTWSRHLREGGMLGMLIDQHMSHGARLSFFGQTALTALSAAELALKYDALLVPIYAHPPARRPVDFEHRGRSADPARHARGDDPGAERQPRGAGAPASRPMVLDSPALEGRPCRLGDPPACVQSTRAAARIAAGPVGLHDHHRRARPRRRRRHRPAAPRPVQSPSRSHEVTMLR